MSTIEQMTDEEIRVEVAKLCGWKNWDHPDCMALKKGYTMPEKWCMNPSGALVFNHDRPDYPNDLNACAEFEKAMLSQSFINRPGTPFHTYFRNLHELCKTPDNVFGEPMQPEHWAITATARQRCIAFLKVKGVL